MLIASQNGLTNVVSFLTETVSAEQLEMLSSLMDAAHCDQLEFA